MFCPTMACTNDFGVDDDRSKFDTAPKNKNVINTEKNGIWNRLAESARRHGPNQETILFFLLQW